MKTPLFALLLIACLPACARDLPLDAIKPPAGFRIGIHAGNNAIGRA
ncbi:MAG: hypothetical protein WCB97_07175 [Thiobacillus sp.]